MGVVFTWLIPMNFPARLTQLRKPRGLSQQRFADLAGLHVNQIKRYESDTAQPTLDALVSVARALHVSLDALVFEEGERGPSEEMRLAAATAAGQQDQWLRRPWAVLGGVPDA